LLPIDDDVETDQDSTERIGEPQSGRIDRGDAPHQHGQAVREDVVAMVVSVGNDRGINCRSFFTHPIAKDT